MTQIELVITFLPIAIWVGLLTARGGFWRIDQVLEEGERVRGKGEGKEEGGEGGAFTSASPSFIPPYPFPLTPSPSFPRICAVIPARNEADLLPVTMRSLLLQDYPGSLVVFLVDDHSTDGTDIVAKSTAEALNKSSQLHVINAEPLPPGWSGKLWAVEQGIGKASVLKPDYFLLTDADIVHDTSNLNRLVSKAVQQNLDLASVMVRLRCESFWEKLLIPAFVFFFQKLYPFNWVNNPNKATAAAAGGCILIRRQALERIGGISTIRQALIDDCALAIAVKKGVGSRDWGDKGDGGAFTSLSPLSPLSPSSPTPYSPLPTPSIWLGLSSLTHSLRPYDSLHTIWDMVARTAFTQLNNSPLLLLGTLLGMTLLYLVSPVGLIWGLITGNWLVARFGLLGWLLMALAYFPMVRFYRCSPLYAFYLPGIAFLYTLMTFYSALRHWQGRGGAWKGRVY
jgi:hopene-associated glycosyltransferase HpnB